MKRWFVPNTTALVIAIAIALLDITYGVLKPAGYSILLMPVLVAALDMFGRRAYLAFTVLVIGGVVTAYMVVLLAVDPYTLHFRSLFRADLFYAHGRHALGSHFVFFATFTLVFQVSRPDYWGAISGQMPRRDVIMFRTLFWPALIMSLVIYYMNPRGPLITEAAYYSAEYVALGAGNQSQVLQSLSLALVLFCAIGSFASGSSGSRYFKIAVGALLFVVVYFYLMRGSRNIVIGLVVLGYILFSVREGKAVVAPKALMFALGCILVLQMWPTVRWLVGRMGMTEAAMIAASQIGSTGSAMNLLEVTRLPNIVWNLLQTIDLYESHVRRGGETYLNLIPQAIPQGVADLIGFKRPIAEPFVLAKYFHHGGAIYPIAEAYWNFGVWAMLTVSGTLALLLQLLERIFRRLSPFYAYIYFFGVVTLTYSFITGTQAFMRYIETMMLLVVGTYIIRQLVVPAIRTSRISRLGC